MTVKELFALVESDRVANAVLLLDYYFSSENFENTLVEKLQAIPRLREIIRENIRLFTKCTPDPDNEAVQYTIFILPIQSDDYANQCKKELSAFCISDKEALEAIGKDFHIFNAEGEARIIHYGVDEAPIDVMAGYRIAELSVEELGAEICAAKILAELLFWGALPEQREKNIKELHERLSKPIDKKELDSKPLEELMSKHEEELSANMSEDEKTYHYAKRRFEEETKEIMRRYQNKIISDNHRLYINAIKKEYSNR